MRSHLSFKNKYENLIQVKKLKLTKLIKTVKFK